jgi:hypothetical protein
MKTDPNEPAYPGTWWDVNSMGETVARETYSGLTKREAMAMHICAGLMAYPGEVGSAAMVADLSVKQADALIAALNAKEGERYEMDKG